MSVSKARQRVEAALALARHKTTAPAERDAAIAGAERIITANGLDRGDFQFPGETAKPPPKSRFADDLFTKPRSPFFDGSWGPDDLEDVFEAFARHMRADRQYSDAAASFAYAAAGAQSRRAADPNRSGPAMDRLRADLAVKFLWHRSPPVRVYRAADDRDGRRWTIPDDGDREFTDEGICEVAERRGWNGSERRPEPTPDELVSAIEFLRTFAIDVYPFGYRDGVELWGLAGVPATRAEVVATARRYGWKEPVSGRRAESAIFDDVEDDTLDRAIAYLGRKGVDVVRVHVPGVAPSWRIEGEIADARRVMFSARLYGFEA